MVENVREDNDGDNPDHTNDIDENVDTRMQEEVDEVDSEGEGDFANEECDEEKISKPKATSDSDDETPAVVKEETTNDIVSSARQRNAPKKLMNQFNFFERCALTEEIILRVIQSNIFLTLNYKKLLNIMELLFTVLIYYLLPLYFGPQLVLYIK